MQRGGWFERCYKLVLAIKRGDWRGGMDLADECAATQTMKQMLQKQGVLAALR